MTANSKRNTLILFASLLVVVGLYVLMYWLPHRRYIARMQSDIGETRRRIDEQRNELARLAALHEELALLNEYHREMAERIPDTINVREFVATVHELSEANGVTLSSFTPLIDTDLVGFHQQPLTLTFTGRFHPIVEVLYRLETIRPLVEITDLDVRPTTKPGDAEEWLDVKADVKLFARGVKPRVISKNTD